MEARRGYYQDFDKKHNFVINKILAPLEMSTTTKQVGMCLMHTPSQLTAADSKM